MSFCVCDGVERAEWKGRNVLGFTFFFSSCFRSGCGLDWAGDEVVLPPPWACSYVVWMISISGILKVSGFGMFLSSEFWFEMYFISCGVCLL